MNHLKKIYTNIATEVADEYYPKGHHQRGEFIRDSAIIYAKLEPKVIELVKGLIGDKEAEGADAAKMIRNDFREAMRKKIESWQED